MTTQADEQIDALLIKRLHDAVELFSEKLRAREISLNDQIEIFTVTCEISAALVEEPTFFTLIRHYASPDTTSAARSVYDNFDLFLGFLAFDRRIFQNVGLTEDAIDELLARMITMRRHLRSFRIDEGRVTGAVIAVRDESCSALELAEQRLAHDLLRGRFLRYSYVIMGAFAVAINSLAGGALGMPPPVTIVSVALGLVMIEESGRM